tara:strand:- start:1842 stop:2249 length:408 start_codon:yes stop_codon:yes gene_type:complete
MATVRIALRVSSTDVLSTSLDVSVASNLLADSGSLIKAKVKGTAADTDDLVIYKADDKLESAYVYIRNLEARKEDYIYVRNETESNTAAVAKIGGGEFAFIPVSPDKTYECIATKVDSVIEYGVFGQDNSSVSLA